MVAPLTHSPDVPALEMRQVKVTALRDSSRTVLQQVNWTVQPGEFWAVGGLVRSGKSDLMALAAGIMRPAEGSYRLFGQELTARYEHEQLALRLRLGLVFDGGQLFHHLTLAGNIALPLQYHIQHTDGRVEQRLAALLAFTEMEESADSYPAYVGRNSQQRIGLARALALKPEVLLLDTPLTGLDPRDAFWWLETIEALSRGHPILDGRPLTVVASSDDLRPWRARARQFAVLRKQEFFVLGGREQLENPPEPLQDWLLPAQAAPGGDPP